MGSAPADPTSNRLGIISLLCLSAWCGLAAGLLEVGTIVLTKQTLDPNRLYGMSRHFVWLIPVTNLGVFLALGFFGYAVTQAWPHRGQWLVLRGLCATSLLPAVLIAFPRVYTLAWFVAAPALAARIVPMVRAQCPAHRRLIQVGIPVAIGIVSILAASLWIGDLFKRSRASTDRSRRPARRASS